MKTTYHICLLLCALIIISCVDKNSYVIKGNIKGLQNSELYIVSNPDLRVDTILTQSGKFSYRGISPTLEPLVIFMENGNVWVTLWVQNGEKFSVTGDANYPELMVIKGGEVNKLLTEFKTENSALIKEGCDLKDKLKVRSEYQTESNVSSSDVQLSSQIKNIDQILKTRAQDFIEANPSTIAALVMIQDYILDIESASDIFPFLKLVADEVKENSLYDKLFERCLRDLNTKIGKPALNFKLVDSKDNVVNLETFKDKYLILTFAASNCDFCEPEYDELLAIHNTFPQKELAILTISLDENKEDWKKLAQEKGINWTQVIDTTGWDSEMALQYNVLSLPCNYLIDKNGIIIGSKLRMENILTILNEKLKKK